MVCRSLSAGRPVLPCCPPPTPTAAEVVGGSPRRRIGDHGDVNSDRPTDQAGEPQPDPTDQAGEPQPDPTDQDRSPEPGSTAPPRPRGMGGTARNMVFSMLAVLAVAVAWWALMPGPEESRRAPVDVAPVAAYASEQSAWPVWVPQDLPESWRATSVRYEPHTDGVLSWRVGYVSPQDEFVGIDQAAEVTDDWVASLVRGGQPQGTTEVDGPDGPATWDRYASDDQNTLVLPGGGPDEATTVVRGTAPFDQLEDFVGQLERWEDDSAS